MVLPIFKSARPRFPRDRRREGMPCSSPQPGDPRRSLLWRHADHARRDRCAGSRARLYRGPSRRMPTKPLRACLASFRRPPCSTTSMYRKGASGSNKAASNTSREICPRRNQKLMYATQAAPVADLFDQKVEGTAWNAKPSWYVLATQDQTVPPDLQRLVSKRMKATTTEVASSHVPSCRSPMWYSMSSAERPARRPDANRRHTARETVARWSPSVVRRCRYAMSILGPSRHFVAKLRFGRLRRKADIGSSAISIQGPASPKSTRKRSRGCF
jgi:hypothetical protein